MASFIQIVSPSNVNDAILWDGPGTRLHLHKLLNRRWSRVSVFLCLSPSDNTVRTFKDMGHTWRPSLLDNCCQLLPFSGIRKTITGKANFWMCFNKAWDRTFNAASMHKLQHSVLRKMFILHSNVLLFHTFLPVLDGINKAAPAKQINLHFPHIAYSLSSMCRICAASLSETHISFAPLCKCLLMTATVFSARICQWRIQVWFVLAPDKGTFGLS